MSQDKPADKNFLRPIIARESDSEQDTPALSDISERDKLQQRVTPKESLNRLDLLRVLTFKFLSLMIKIQNGVDLAIKSCLQLKRSKCFA